jgi:hypothetical protein
VVALLVERVEYDGAAGRVAVAFRPTGIKTLADELNRPYGFIRCQCAKSEEIVDDFDTIRQELVGSDGRVIIWLDYTEADMRHDQLFDLEQLTRKLVHGDILRITINAHRPNFGETEHYQLAKKAGETDLPTQIDWWNQQLIDQLKEYMPDERKGVECIETDDEFAITLARAIKRAAQNGLAPRPILLIEPLPDVRPCGQHVAAVFARAPYETSPLSRPPTDFGPRQTAQ